MEILPFLLFLIGVNPEDPSDIYFERIETVFIDPAACEEAGAQAVQDRKGQMNSHGDEKRYQLQYRCVEFPSEAELNQAFSAAMRNRLNNQ